MRNNAMKHSTRAQLPAVIALAAVAITLPLGLSRPAAAQVNPTTTNLVPESEAVTIQARITALDPRTRAVTLVGASGERVTVIAGPAVRLEMLKVGDRVNAKYYRSVAFVVNPPRGGNGVPTSDNAITQIIAQPAQAPGGVALRLTRISGTIVGINMAAHSVDLVNPSGGPVRTLDVTDPSRIALLGTLNVGDTVTAVVSETLAVSIERAPRRWF
jgi:hypothetical protein